MRKAGFEIFEISEHGKNPLRYLRALSSLFANRDRYDLIFANFRSQEMFPFMLLAGKPIILDAFISMKQTIAQEKLGLKKGSIIENLIGKLEQILYRRARLVLVDTKAHAEYFRKEYRLKNVDYIYTGADAIFKSMKSSAPARSKSKKKTAIWYGSNQSLHGLNSILGAAGILKDDPGILFKLIINKKDGEELKNWAKKENMHNLIVSPPLPYAQLPKEIAAADICLMGAFGLTEKANLVITGKTYHCLAMEKPVIIADTKATREVFTHKKDCLIIRRGSEKEMADAIRLLACNDNLRNSIAANGFKLYSEKFDVKSVKTKLETLIAQLPQH